MLNRILSRTSPRVLSLSPRQNSFSSSIVRRQMSSDEMKRQKLSLIGTHSGTFHCDEAMACFMLKQLPSFAEAKVLRTREADALAQCDIVVDVGAVYDPEKNLFDHHQRGFTETLDSEHSIKLSSAGLIYKHFGKEVIKCVVRQKIGRELSSDEVEKLYFKLYDNLLASVDGIDNGVYAHEIRKGFDHKLLHCNYLIRSDLASRVARLNPSWNEENVTDDTRDSRFQQAMKLTGEEFTEQLISLVNSWLPIRDMISEAYNKRFEHHSSGHIVVMETPFPWKDQLFDLEAEKNVSESEKIIYVLYPDTANAWRVQTVPIDSQQAFSSRKALPEKWRGLRSEELSQESGIPGCIFVHAAGFVGGNETKEGALEMASKALEL